ncbi:hypothetical protein C1H46_005347 [Malus baccata]|uniref:Uncharacterized protein n=1 Tax=Malus baccata TaxID=106549 RepID=A0A540ND41_MALBA|nr:hypothetical protein C1H46_005347 [Malus baccata]
MALSSFSIKFGSISCPYESHRTGTSPRLLKLNHVLSVRVSADSTPKARFVARRTESVSVPQLQRPLSEYMSLPASQYSVLDAERIERVDANTFRCYVYRFKFFAFEVCPVLLVKVEEQPNGCSIKLLSCKLDGSPIAVAQNDKFDGQPLVSPRPDKLRVANPGLWSSSLTLIWYGNAAFMVNQISCASKTNSSLQELKSDTVIEVSIDIPFAFRAIPVQAIESSGTQVLEQILRIMLPRFMSQLVRDYRAWASGDRSRQPLGTGEI